MILWCALIFVLSSIPNHKGKTVDFETSYGILEFLARKFAHFAEYAVLMVLTYRAIQGESDKPVPGRLILTFLFVLLYSASDEWHQTYVFGRNGTPFDIFVDSVSALMGYFFCHWKDQGKYEEEKTHVDQSPAQVEN